jgi:hypothetical protein
MTDHPCLSMRCHNNDHSRSNPGQPPVRHTHEPRPWPIEGAQKSKEKNKIKIHLGKNSRERYKIKIVGREIK